MLATDTKSYDRTHINFKILKYYSSLKLFEYQMVGENDTCTK